jgi:hypothetical protein
VIRPLVVATVLLGLAATGALAQGKPAEKPKTLWDEVNLFAYNRPGAGRTGRRRRMEPAGH